MKVLIVGGGLAGMAAALNVRALGHEVVLAERQRGVLDRVCGEGILPFGVELLRDLGLKELLVEGSRFRGIGYHCGSFHAMGTFPDGVFGLGIHRAKLHEAFQQKCLALGIDIREGWKVAPNDFSAYDRVLAADGIHSRHGARMAVAGRLGLRFRLMGVSIDRVHVTFFRGFEVYLTPTGPDTVSVAMLLCPRQLNVSGIELRDHCIKLFQTHFPQYADQIPVDVAIRGPIAGKRPGSSPAIHLLGDACQAFDPISGAGMSFALLCGKLAALHLDDPAAYWRAVAPHRRAIGLFTNTILFFRGGGFRSRLMVRQLSRAQASFDRIVGLHNGRAAISDLGIWPALALLKP